MPASSTKGASRGGVRFFSPLKGKEKTLAEGTVFGLGGLFFLFLCFFFFIILAVSVNT